MPSSKLVRLLRGLEHALSAFLTVCRCSRAAFVYLTWQSLRGRTRNKHDVAPLRPPLPYVASPITVPSDGVSRGSSWGNLWAIDGANEASGQPNLHVTFNFNIHTFRYHIRRRCNVDFILTQVSYITVTQNNYRFSKIHIPVGF